MSNTAVFYKDKCLYVKVNMNGKDVFLSTEDIFFHSTQKSTSIKGDVYYRYDDAWDGESSLEVVLIEDELFQKTESGKILYNQSLKSDKNFHYILDNYFYFIPFPEEIENTKAFLSEKDSIFAELQ